MDLIGALSSEMGVSEGKAKGLAGSLLGLVQGAVKEHVSEDTASQFGAQVPEAQVWQQEGETPDDDEGGGLGDLLGMGMGMLGASSGSAGLVAGVAKVVEKFGLEPSHAAVAAPLITQFIESKVDPDLLAKVKPVLAMFGGGGDGGGAGGGLGGMLGGLLGG